MKAPAPLRWTEALAAAGVTGAAALVLGAFPVATLVLLGVRLGLHDAGLVLTLEGLVALALAAMPLRARSAARARLYAAIEDGAPARAWRVVAVAIAAEVAVVGVAVTALAVTAPWWSARVLGGDVPWTLLALAAAHAAARRLGLLASSLAAAARKASPLPALLPLLELTAAAVIVAAVAGSVRGVLLGAALVGAALAALGLAAACRDVAAALGPAARRPRAPDAPDAAAPWTPLGAWAESVARATVRPLIAAVAGLAAVVPVAAAATLQGVLFLPLVLVAAAGAPSRTERAVRAAVIAAAGFVIAAVAGPPLFRLIYPASFHGAADLLHTTAWASAALLFAPLRREHDPGHRADPWLQLAAAAVHVVALAALIPVRGLDGVVLAWTLGLAASTIAMFLDRGAATPARASGVQP